VVERFDCLLVLVLRVECGFWGVLIHPAWPLGGTLK